MKNRAARDPYAPKRNLSAYLLFQNAMRDTFKAENPSMSFGELSKYTSLMYSQLTVEDKAAWQARAEQDKERYLHEMSTYVPSAGYDQNGLAIAQYPHVTGSKKKQRDPMAPKRNLSAYLLYQNAMRDQFKSDNPGMTFGQLSKYTSHMYKSLTPEEKAQWQDRAQSDKERYDEEMKHYAPPHGFDANGNLLAEFAVPRKNSRKNPKDPNMPKRARGSFVLFTFDERPRIFAENPTIKFTDLGAVLGQRWRALPPDERKKYDDLAEQDKVRFAQEMVLYKEKLNEQEQHLRLAHQHEVASSAANIPGTTHVAVAHGHGIIQDGMYHTHEQHHGVVGVGVDVGVQEEDYKFATHQHLEQHQQHAATTEVHHHGVDAHGQVQQHHGLEHQQQIVYKTEDGEHVSVLGDQVVYQVEGHQHQHQVETHQHQDVAYQPTQHHEVVHEHQHQVVNGPLTGSTDLDHTQQLVGVDQQHHVSVNVDPGDTIISAQVHQDTYGQPQPTTEEIYQDVTQDEVAAINDPQGIYSAVSDEHGNPYYVG